MASMNQSEDFLDPRDENNWQKLSEKYEHLSHFIKDDEGNFDSKMIDFPSKERVEFLRTEDGLLALHSAWTIAVKRFSKGKPDKGQVTFVIRPEFYLASRVVS